MARCTCHTLHTMGEGLVCVRVCVCLPPHTLPCLALCSFRYVKISTTGSIKSTDVSVEALHFHTQLEQASSFSSSSMIINRIQVACPRPPLLPQLLLAMLTMIVGWRFVLPLSRRTSSGASAPT